MTTMKTEEVPMLTKNSQHNTSLKEISRDQQDSKDKGAEMIYTVYQ